MTAIHKAAPASVPTHLGDVDRWVCISCGGDINRVPGGQGPTWVHTATGAVVGSGSPILETDEDGFFPACQWCAGDGCKSCGFTGRGDTHESGCDCIVCTGELAP
jgi:hypothetical protein